MNSELDSRQRHLLLQLALVSEGATTRWEPGHQQPDSRPPADSGHDHLPARAPSKHRSLHDHWAWKFAHARDEGTLLTYLTLAEEDLIRAHRTPPSMPALGEAKTARICSLGDQDLTVEEVAAREHVNGAHVRKVWQEDGRDPVTGDRLPEDRERLYEYARALAREGATDSEVARRTGLARGTLQRHLT